MGGPAAGVVGQKRSAVSICDLLMQELTEKIRGIIGDDPNVSERKMFGGVCFLLNGNMLCGSTKQGDLMLRVGKDRQAQARSRPHAREMDFTGRPMAGFVFVDPDGINDKAQLEDWIALATEFVASLPPK